MKKLSDKAKKNINNIVFYLLILIIVLLCIKAWNIFQEDGLKYCLKEETPFTGEIIKVCFNTSIERYEYLKNLSETCTNNLDYKYINKNPCTKYID